MKPTMRRQTSRPSSVQEVIDGNFTRFACYHGNAVPVGYVLGLRNSARGGHHSARHKCESQRPEHYSGRSKCGAFLFRCLLRQAIEVSIKVSGDLSALFCARSCERRGSLFFTQRTFQRVPGELNDNAAQSAGGVHKFTEWRFQPFAGKVFGGFPAQCAEPLRAVK